MVLKFVIMNFTHSWYTLYVHLAYQLSPLVIAGHNYEKKKKTIESKEKLGNLESAIGG